MKGKEHGRPPALPPVVGHLWWRKEPPPPPPKACALATSSAPRARERARAGMVLCVRVVGCCHKIIAGVPQAARRVH